MGNKINKMYIIPATMILGAGLLLTACNKENNGGKMANVTPESVKVDKNVGKPPKDSEKMPENTIKTLNNFSSDTFNELLKYNFDQNNLDSQIYSPFSYLSTLELLSNNAYYSKDNELSKYMNLNLDKFENPNLKSENLALLNVKSGTDKNKIKDLKNFKAVEFPKQAEKESKDLQNRVLDEVLLEPKYEEPNLSMVLLNATKFEGIWANKFDKSITSDEDYMLMDGTSIKTKMMHSEDLTKHDSNIGYEDNDVQIYRKPVSTVENIKKSAGKDQVESTGDVYIINPKGLGKDINKNKQIIENISKNIEKYVNEFDEKAEIFDEIYVDMPKLDIKSNINLEKIAKKNGKKFITDEYDLQEKTGVKDMQKISSILQAATLKLDEEKVEAKAATQVEMVTTSLKVNTKDLYIKADHPHFIVITTRNVQTNSKKLKDSIIFTAFVNNPTQK